MNIQKKIAAKILKCGESKIWIDPKRLDDVKQAITRNDVKRLIKDGIIKKMQKKGRAKKEKRKRRGRGHRKGSIKALKKRLWIKKIRALRRYLNELKHEKKISNSTYRDLYKKAKAGFFDSKAQLKIYLKRNNLFIGVNKNVQKA